MRAAIIVVTHNRREDLARALRSCLQQHGSPEILVVDDASDDGSGEMVCREFPGVRYIRDDTSRGYVVQRNRAAELTDADILVSIDDDAEFSDPRLVAATLRDFEVNPSIAAVAIPYSEPPCHEDVRQTAPDGERCWIAAQFIGTAYAVRRKVFVSLGGFDSSLVHQGEERDFCLRLLVAGYHVRLGTSSPIIHHRSSARDKTRMAYFGRRNDLWFIWRHVPFPQMIYRMAASTLAGFWHGLRNHEIVPTFRGIVTGFVAICFGKVRRQPVASETYNHFRRLREHGPTAL
ncbi:MAG: glycosyltransferase family 2 protein [Verrucomicrobiales bacterium]